DLIQSYAATFIPRFDRYPFQQPDGSYIAVNRPLTLDLVEAHLKGHITIGAYALDEQNQAKYLALDADEPNEWERLQIMARDFEQRKLPVYLEQSRRGGHLFLFVHPMPGRDIRRF